METFAGDLKRKGNAFTKESLPICITHSTFNFLMNLPNFCVAIWWIISLSLTNLTLKLKGKFYTWCFWQIKFYRAIFLSPYLMTFPECQESSEATSGVGCLCFQCCVLRTFAHPMIFSNFPLTDSMTHCCSKVCSKFVCPNKFSSFSSVNDFRFYSIVTEKYICCDFLLLDLVRTC